MTSKRKFILLKETTIWNNNTPNHQYILESKSSLKISGYIPEGSSEPIFFSSPMMFDRRNRTFIETPLYI